MANHLLHGLRVHSEVALPGLSPARGAPDLTIRLGSVGIPLSEDGPPAPYRAMAVDDAIVYWERCGRFRIAGGREITVDVGERADWPAIRLQLLGPCLGALLGQRGRLVLHGCAVRTSSASGSAGVVLFVGPSGAGKSTLAAALRQRGYELLSDDMSVITEGLPPRVIPGLPRIKLWPDSAVRLGLVPERLPRICEQTDKRAVQLSAGAVGGAAEVLGIYFLHDGPGLRLERSPATDQLVELIAHTYGINAWPASKLPQHLDRCAELIDRVPVCRLYRPRDLARLDELVDFVEQQVLGPCSSGGVRAA